MSGLFGSLTQSVQALSAHSRAIETAGRNLANVNNPSYARQRVLYADRGTVVTPNGAQSLGLEAKSIQQIRDSLLDAQVVREVGLSASLNAQNTTLLNAQAALGESIDRASGTEGTTDSAYGLSASITDFFNAFQSFAARPTDQGERQNLVQQAEIMTERFNETDRRLAQIQTDVDSEVATDVDDINRLLSSIGELNAQIGRIEINNPGSAADLRDQRQARIEELAGKMSIETAPNATETGQVDVFVRDASGNPVVLVSLATVVNPVAYDGAQLTAGASATPIALSGGSVSGLLTARDGAVQTLRDGIDALANQLASAVNAAYNPTGVSGDFFTITPSSGAATLSLNSSITATSLKASETGGAADNTQALAVAELVTKKFSTASGDAINGTITQHYTSVVSDLGRAVSGVQSRLEDQSNIETLVLNQRQAVSGVSIDEEMADMLKFQRAFEAASRVVNIIDGLLDIVVNRLGA